MKKKIPYLWISYGAALLLYCVLTLTLGNLHSGTFWSAFVFTLVAFALLAAICRLTMTRGGADRTFLNAPVLAVTLLYWAVQLVAGVLLMLLGPGLTATNLIQIAILALWLILWGAAMFQRKHIRDLDSRIYEKRAYISELLDRLAASRALPLSPAAAARLDALCEQVRFSDPVSAQELAPLEQTIGEKADALSLDAQEEVFLARCAELTRLVEERNRKCLALKRKK